METKISKKHTGSAGQQYPYLAIHRADLGRKDPEVVLFRGEDDGILLYVNQDGEMRVGDASGDEEHYIPFTGEITMKN